MTDQEKLNIVREWLSNIDQAISGLRDSVELLHERPAAVEAKASLLRGQSPKIVTSAG